LLLGVAAVLWLLPAPIQASGEQRFCVPAIA
jgi:hypothetical protein